MKIRTRIALWVSLAGLASSTVLSLVIFFLGLETPREYLDQELDLHARAVAEELTRELQANRGLVPQRLELFSRLYWMRIYDEQRQPVFASELAREIPLPLKTPGDSYLVPTEIPLNRFFSDEGANERTAFWNRVFNIPVGEAAYLVHLARPMESLVWESIETTALVGLALLASVVVVIVVSYLVAGRILRPIREINSLAREITENTLATRLPRTASGDEIDELAASLNQMFDRLHSSFRRQKEFVANASHELKTPITLLRLSLEETLQDERLPVDVQERLLAQERALSRMQQLVKNLLDLSRLELTERLERTTFCLHALLRTVLDEFQVLLDERRLTLQADLAGALPIQADREKIQRALINLIDNAIRYNVPGGTVTCRTFQEATRVRVTITNTGQGIAAEDQVRIFDQFFRCEKSRASEHGGAGLGLTIVQRIVELHGGRLTIDSTPAGPTCLLVDLPCIPDVAPRPPNLATAARPGHGPTDRSASP
jgi:signal transduction histidine kinase